MPYGFGAALTWALDTVILGIALANPAFAATPQAIALAAFTSTFLHDASSAVFAFAYMGIRRKLGETWRTLRSKSGLVILGAALIGGPIGMTGYVLAINNIGPAYTAAISAFFPAYGAALATVVLKERMRPYQWAGLAACLVAVAVLGWTPVDGVPGSWTMGIIGALVCVFGWGTEAVVIDWGLRNASVDDECAMQIRQTTSAVTYALVILPLLGGWPSAIEALTSSAMPVIALAALSGTVSYLLYYKAIAAIGASRAMALNITYSAWAIPFSLLLLGTMPDVRGVVCAVVIILGAITAATDVKTLFGHDEKAAA
ncbi:MAG: DMT family transporter [Olsenella sp.]|jgi:drug/metabolite transporter (DMT)-like permease|nr:DMT family transporter [Olsenella sp.]MCH3956426.1 DMT family transporter [Olsenella sp.]MCI1645485.1 DMT family transporter [Olsenella sp.]MCI1666829.1 DMT family transporter [Olsenella sp.]MCI1793643.1 DMT family transporter [Olsenella sp.]